MKKYLLLLSLIASVNLLVYAQSTNFIMEDSLGTNIGNTVVQVESFDAINEHVNSVNLVNQTGSELTIIVKKYELSLSGDSRVYFCVGETCYPSFTLTSQPFTVPANGSLNYPEGFAAHFEPRGSFGDSEVMFSFINSDNTSDSMTVTYQYSIDFVSVYEFAKVTNATVYPNPASNQVRVDYTFQRAGNQNYFVLHNMLGSEMKRVALSNSEGQVSVDLSDLKPGVYFYSIVEKGVSQKTSRLVINR